MMALNFDKARDIAQQLMRMRDALPMLESHRKTLMDAFIIFQTLEEQMGEVQQRVRAMQDEYRAMRATGADKTQTEHDPAQAHDILSSTQGDDA